MNDEFGVMNAERSSEGNSALNTHHSAFKVPAIRFEGFSGAWANKKIGDIFQVTSGATPLRSDTRFFENADVSWVKTTDLNNGVIITTEENISQTALVETSVKMLPKGTVFVAMYGGFNQIGRTGLLETEATCNQALSAIYPNDKVESYFLLTYLNLKVEVWKDLAASSRKDPNITKSDVLAFPFFYPTIKEQTKIGHYFQQLDTLIAQHQNKHDKLLNIKKALLEKLFPRKNDEVGVMSDEVRMLNDELGVMNEKPNSSLHIHHSSLNTPALRFKGFSGEWEERNITKLSKVFIGLVTTMTKSYRSKGVLLIRNSDIKNNRFEFSDAPIYLDESFADENAGRQLKVGDVVTVHTGDVGTSAVVTKNEENAIGFATIVSRPEKGIVDPNYLSVFLNTDTHKCFAMNVSTGDGRANYNLKDFYKLNVPYTVINEQAKIGNLFKQLDTLITQHQAQLKKLNNIKQACLEKMFV